MRKIIPIAIAATFLSLASAGGASAAEPIPVTPQVVVIDECGTQYDRVRTVQVRGIVYTVTDRPNDGYAIVRANALPGYVIAVPNDTAVNPFLYNAHSEGATANLAYTNQLPCWPN